MQLHFFSVTDSCWISAIGTRRLAQRGKCFSFFCSRNILFKSLSDNGLSGKLCSMDKVWGKICTRSLSVRGCASPCLCPPPPFLSFSLRRGSYQSTSEKPSLTGGSGLWIQVILCVWNPWLAESRCRTLHIPCCLMLQTDLQLSAVGLWSPMNCVSGCGLQTAWNFPCSFSAFFDNCCIAT